MPESNRLSRRLAAGLGVAAAISLLGGLWILFADDSGPGQTRAERFMVDTVTVELDGDIVTLFGVTTDEQTGRALADALSERPDVVAVINHLEYDEAVPPPALATFQTGMDALAGRAG